VSDVSVSETETGKMPVPLWGRFTVVTMAIRASTGMRLSAMLQPTQPARRAVAESGLRLMMAEGGNAKLGTSRRFFNPPCGEFVLHEIEVRHPAGLDGVDLIPSKSFCQCCCFWL
jgi:hypothetical protein